MDAGLRKLLDIRNGLILHQAICAVAKLGIADLLELNASSVSQLAAQLNVNEDALYRTLRALASNGVFEETGARQFKNSEFSALLRRDVPGSIRPAFLYFGSDAYQRPFGEFLFSIESGHPAATLFRKNDWEYMAANPELAGVFDDAMTNMSSAQGPVIADAYDFGKWDSIVDVGGGNGILLSCILRRFTNLRGVLADQPHVLERARRRAFLSGELTERAVLCDCDFFKEVPDGYRAYLMKNVIHDWDDSAALKILGNCRRVVPRDGTLLLVEWLVSDANRPSTGKMSDLIMLVLTGGRERTVEEYRCLLEQSGFRLNHVIATAVDLAVFEAVPS